MTPVLEGIEGIRQMEIDTLRGEMARLGFRPIRKDDLLPKKEFVRVHIETHRVTSGKYGRDTFVTSGIPSGPIHKVHGAPGTVVHHHLVVRENQFEGTFFTPIEVILADQYVPGEIDMNMTRHFVRI